MDTAAVLAAFDEQLRRRPKAGPADRVENGARVTRVVSDGDGWSGVIWSSLTEADADTVIAAQIRRFAALGQAWEWKHYSYDRPADLPARLRPPASRQTRPRPCSSPGSPTWPGSWIRPRAWSWFRSPARRKRRRSWPSTTRSSAAVTKPSARLCSTGSGCGPRRWPRSSRWPGTLPSRPDGWSSPRGVTSPASGVAARCQPGADAGSSARWSPTGPGSLINGATGTCTSTPLPTAGPSSGGWASRSWPRRRRTSTPLTQPTFLGGASYFSLVCTR